MFIRFVIVADDYGCHDVAGDNFNHRGIAYEVVDSLVVAMERVR